MKFVLWIILSFFVCGIILWALLMIYIAFITMKAVIKSWLDNRK